MTDLNPSGEKKSGTQKNNNPKKERVLKVLPWAVIAVLLVATILSFASYQKQMKSLAAVSSGSASYRYHFSFVGDRTKAFQQAVYQAASETAQSYGDYLEFTGSTLDISYSTEELLDIAASSAPDGIILNANDTDGMQSSIDSAAATGIPVILIGTDIYGSARQSYVGISNYTLGQTYGQCLLTLPADDLLDVLVIYSPEEHTTGQNLVISGMKDFLSQKGQQNRFEISSRTVGDSKSFSTAEDVTDLFESGDLPDVLICLDETSTTCACQAVVDYNRVGDVAIFGYYINDVILDAISKDVINGTLTVSTDEIGRNAVDNLESYLSTGFTNEYAAIGIETVTKDNVSDYGKEGVE